MIHLVQISDGSSRRVAIVEEPRLHCLAGVQSVYELAQQCLSLGRQQRRGAGLQRDLFGNL
jgi:hypothetical protein